MRHTRSTTICYHFYPVGITNNMMKQIKQQKTRILHNQMPIFHIINVRTTKKHLKGKEGGMTLVDLWGQRGGGRMAGRIF